MISINLFCCYEKVFTYTSTWIIGENSMKQHYHRKKSPEHRRYNWCRLDACKDLKRVCKGFKTKHSAQELAWQSAFKTKVKLDLLTDIDTYQF